MECGAFAVGPGRAIAVVFQWVDSVQDEPCITRAWPMDVVVMGILVCYSGS